MQRNTAQAGGIFLTIGILGGFSIGAALGDPLGYALIGTAAGIAVAVLLWLVDRRRRS